MRQGCSQWKSCLLKKKILKIKFFLCFKFQNSLISCELNRMNHQVIMKSLDNVVQQETWILHYIIILMQQFNNDFYLKNNSKKILFNFIFGNLNNCMIVGHQHNHIHFDKTNFHRCLLRRNL